LDFLEVSSFVSAFRLGAAAFFAGSALAGFAAAFVVVAGLAFSSVFALGAFGSAAFLGLTAAAAFLTVSLALVAVVEAVEDFVASRGDRRVGAAAAFLAGISVDIELRMEGVKTSEETFRGAKFFVLVREVEVRRLGHK